MLDFADVPNANAERAGARVAVAAAMVMPDGETELGTMT